MGSLDPDEHGNFLLKMRNDCNVYVDRYCSFHVKFLLLESLAHFNLFIPWYITVKMQGFTLGLLQ